MLRIHQSKSASSAKAYYSHADYYGEGQEKAGQWYGKLAQQLGLSGTIEQAHFNALCDNLDPRTGKQLTARHNDNRTIGYDFNWHVPKGVSLAYAIGGDQRIEQVFARSVEETMHEIETEAKTRVRTAGRDENRTTGNLAWGQFIHTTARPNDQGEVDPHLHAHCFVFNATWDDKDKRFKAGQFRDLKRDARFFEARMHARLAKALKEELGYSIRRDGKSWDIDGISKETKQKFSRRTQEIESLAQEIGIENPDRKAELAAETRNTKVNHQSMPELQQAWRSRLTPEEATFFECLSENEGSGSVYGQHDLEESVKMALSHSFERESIVPERKVLEQAMRFGVGIVDVHEVAGEAKRQGLISRRIEGRVMATTPAVLGDEKRVLSFAKDGIGSAKPLNRDWKPTESWLSEEQLEAIHRLTSSRNRLQLILGGAGTGKTTLMQQAVAAIEAGGTQVMTFAPTAEASRRVLRDEGFATATTVAELLINPKLQEAIEDQVIWIDEASLLGSRQLRQVFDLADKKNARVILSGDWKRQHGSVDRGGVLSLIDQYTPIKPIQINTIRRQQGQYRDAIATMSKGRTADGFDALDQLGWVHELEDGDRLQMIAKDFADLTEKEESALVLSPTHKEGAHATAAIRRELKQRGRIGEQEVSVSRLIPRHLTEAERSDPAFFQKGDVIVFHQNAKGHRKGERITVTDSMPSEITELASRYSVYHNDQIALAKGDLVRLTAGGTTKDRKHRVNNGAVLTFDGLTETGDLRFTNGRVLAKEFGHLAYGFVATSHASQGRTVDHVLIAESAESFPAASREQLYVSASRGRHSARIYTDSKEELKAAVSESSLGQAALPSFLPPDVMDGDRIQKQRLRRQLDKERTQTKELVHER
ncbi:MAG: MobF family relaxase [Fuerstiella sp.]